MSSPRQHAISKLDTFRERMFKPTSKSDLSYMLNDKVKIITYSQLDDFSSFSDLIHPYNACILLYPNYNDPNIGHWCCVFVRNNVCEYFDPYGCYIDEPIGDYNQTSKIDGIRRVEPKLLKLLVDSEYAHNVFWNETAFQNEDLGSQTCGLWNVLRLKNSHLPELEFKKIYYDLPNKSNIAPDLLVSAIICSLFPEFS